jgi:isoleucyl-tRNA synthetase
VDCTTCGEALATKELIDHVANLFAKEGSDAWFKHPVTDLIPYGMRCPRCGGTSFEKEQVIVDVWFESGVSWAAVCENKKDLWPIDLYLEGSDQHRGWFHSAMLTSTATRDRAPYQTVLTHGFVVDEKGHPYSKSLKNYIPPDNVIKTKGAELFRLWAAYVDYRNDIPFSDALLNQLGDSYRKIRNTCRFLLGNLQGYSPEMKVDPAHLSTLDRWALERLNRLILRCRKAYEDYEFHLVYRSLIEFCTIDMSAFYLDVAKDRLYCDGFDAPERRATQMVLYRTARALATLMAPVLCFTAEDIWQELPKTPEDVPSVHLAQLPEAEATNDELTQLVDGLRRLRDGVLKELEAFRAQKHHSLDAKVILSLNEADRELVQSYGEEQLADLFIVSAVAITTAAPEGGVTTVTVEEATGVKCPRCWKRSEGTNNLRSADLCPRCNRVLEEAAVKEQRASVIA